MDEEAAANFQIDEEQRLFLESLGYLGEEGSKPDSTGSDSTGSGPTESGPGR